MMSKRQQRIENALEVAIEALLARLTEPSPTPAEAKDLAHAILLLRKACVVTESKQ